MRAKAKLRRPSIARDLLDPEFDSQSFSVERDINHRRTAEEFAITHRKPHSSRLDAIWLGLVR